MTLSSARRSSSHSTCSRHWSAPRVPEPSAHRDVRAQGGPRVLRSRRGASARRERCRRRHLVRHREDGGGLPSQARIHVAWNGPDPGVVRDLRALGVVEACELDVSSVPAFEDLDPTEMQQHHRPCALHVGHRRRDHTDVFAFIDDLCSFDLREELTCERSLCRRRDQPTRLRSPLLPPRRMRRGVVHHLAVPRWSNIFGTSSSIPRRRARHRPGHGRRGRARVAGRRDGLRDVLSTMERHTRDLQERVMAIRMVPLSTVFRRFPRLVRDTAATVGKKVRLLQIQGEGTEIDKSMVEKLVDPLTHLVRNAIHHGSKAPDERRAAGKVDEGAVTLSALHQGGNVVIEVRGKTTAAASTARRSAPRPSASASSRRTRSSATNSSTTSSSTPASRRQPR